MISQRFNLSQKIICFLLVFALMFTLIGMPIQAHALGAELAATLGLGTSLGPVAPVILAILLGAGLGIGAANVTPALIERFNTFVSQTQSQANADIATLASAYAAHVEEIKSQAVSSGTTYVPASTYSVQLTAPIVEAVKTFVDTNAKKVQASDTDPVVFTLDATNSTNLVLANAVYTVSPATVPSHTVGDFYNSTGDYINSGVEVAAGSGLYFGFHVRQQAANLAFYSVLLDSDNRVIAETPDTIQTIRVGTGSSGETYKTHQLNLSWSNTVNNSTFNHRMLNGLTLSIVVVSSSTGNTIITTSCTSRVIADPSYTYSLSGPVVAGMTGNAADYFNLYPFVYSADAVTGEYPELSTPFSPVSVDLGYTPQLTYNGEYLALSDTTMTDQTVIAVPVPGWSIEEGVDVPDETAAGWSDVLINFPPSQFRGEQLAPPVDPSDTLTWPTTQIPVLDISDPATWPLDWSPDLVSDIAGDTALDPDVSENWFPRLFRIPILGNILQILYLIWQMISRIVSMIKNFFDGLLQTLGNWLKSIWDALKAVWDRLGTIVAYLAQLLSDLPAALLAIFEIVTGYTLFQTLLGGFLPEVVVSVLWVFWMAAIAIWFVRWIADR